MTFEQRLATALFLLLTLVMIYAMFTGTLDVSLAISALTGLVATIAGGKSLVDLLKKDTKKEKSDD